MHSLCKERDGEVWRRLIPLERDHLVAVHVAEKMSVVPNFLQGNSPEVLIADGSAFFLVDDVGIAGVVGIQVGVGAHAHITFWDGRLRGREGLCKDVAHLMLWTYSLELLFTAVPSDHKTLLAFVKRVGFVPAIESQGQTGLILYRRNTNGS